MPHPKRIAILGAGPIGIEAALHARALNHDVIVFERGEVADSVASWGFVRLFSPWRMNITPLGMRVLGGKNDIGDPDACPAGGEFRERYLLPLAASTALKDCIQSHTQVLAVGREDFLKSDEIGTGRRAGSAFRILVRDASGKERLERADVVLDCTGTYGHHRWAGRGGIPAVGEQTHAARITYTIPDLLGKDRQRFAGRHVLLIGSGHSAATTLADLEKLCADAPETRVTWVMRKPGPAMAELLHDPLPQRARLAARARELVVVPPRWLQILPNVAMESVEGSSRLAVVLSSESNDLALEVDEIVAMVGYSPDTSIYDQLQIHQCYASAGPIKLAAALLGERGADCLTAGQSLTAETLINPEPDFFILGAKSYGTNSNFLLQIGHQQIRDVFTLIGARPAS